jgi:hypothetical protein
VNRALGEVIHNTFFSLYLTNWTKKLERLILESLETYELYLKIRAFDIGKPLQPNVM